MLPMVSCTSDGQLSAIEGVMASLGVENYLCSSFDILGMGTHETRLWLLVIVAVLHCDDGL